MVARLVRRGDRTTTFLVSGPIEYPVHVVRTESYGRARDRDVWATLAGDVYRLATERPLAGQTLVVVYARPRTRRAYWERPHDG